MQNGGMWDLRKPSGIFFTLVGLVLLTTAVVEPDAAAPLASSRVNLFSGVVNLVFGGCLLWLSMRRN
jgi:hypothetical protein